MKTIKKDWVVGIILLIPFLFIIYKWNEFPAQIPTHFNFDGEPDDYSGKVFGLFLLPVINVVLYILFILLPHIDPLRKNYALFSDKFKIIRTVLHLFLVFVFFIVAFYSLGYELNTTTAIIYGVLLLFLFLGNYMGNIRHNYFIGIRTPWTLANEEVWNKTHRLTAKLWVFATILMLLLSPVIPHLQTVFIIYIGLITIIPIVYSYVEFKKRSNK